MSAYQTQLSSPSRLTSARTRPWAPSGSYPRPSSRHPCAPKCRAVKAALRPWAARQMYLGFAETQQDTATFWTEQAYHRLRRIKTADDPDDLIRSNHPIPRTNDDTRGPQVHVAAAGWFAAAATAASDVRG